MFSQHTKNLWNQPRGSVSSDSSQEPGASLFYSVPNLLADAEIRESISLQPSQVRNYNQYDDDDEYLGSNPVPGTDFLEAPFSDNRNTQTAAAIYRNIPPTPITRVSSDTLSEGLLPSSSIPPPLLSGLSHRKFRDPAFAVLFIIGLTTMSLIGLFLLFTTSSSPDYTRGTVFAAIYYSAWQFFFSILFSICVGAIWIFLLRSFAQPLIWGILVSVPFIFAIMFIWIVVAALTGPRQESGKRDPQDILLLILSFMPLFISLGSVIGLYTRRKDVEKTINIIELACEIFNANHRILGVSLILLGSYVLFTIIWLIFFSRAFLIGLTVQISTDVFNTKKYLLILFFIFMHMWTFAVLKNIQRVTLAGVVSDWYFYRREQSRDTSKDTPTLAFHKATTSSLGSICLGSLIMFTVQCLQFTSEFVKKNSKLNTVFYHAATCMSYIDGLIDVLNNYTLIYVGISGESFCSSAMFTTKLFRRNLIFGLVNDTVTKGILLISSITISLFCGFATFIYATHSLQSPYGYIAGILAFIIPYYVSQFFVCIMKDTIDATFLCYTIDLDTNKTHCPKAHDAFSNFQIQ
ncbi:plasma-membrane choline transporter-domain-containing protein [Gigaspora rosea]|uniref:Protein PNS1 n=1 Tax=Gigaspora rosea TaxID=44941 RepID=A0A397UET8_9GLOM|nr:plasma-membrane choline transporter-domain-containing protein [Gigaspora rosea]